MKKLKQIFALCLSLFCIFGLMTPVFAEGGDSNSDQGIAVYGDYGGDNVEKVEQVYQNIKSRLDAYNFDNTEELTEDTVRNAVGDLLNGVTMVLSDFSAEYGTKDTEGYVKVTIILKDAGYSHAYHYDRMLDKFEVTQLNVSVWGDTTDLGNVAVNSDGVYVLQKGVSYLFSVTYTGKHVDGATMDYYYNNFVTSGLFTKDNNSLLGINQNCYSVIASTEGTAEVEILDGTSVKVQVVDNAPSPTPTPSPTTPKLTVTNFDDVTVEAGTLDIDLWPKVEWDYANTKDWKEVLSVSKDGGKSWTNEYDLSPSTGADSLAVPLKVSDSGRKYRLVFTYQGKELFNKTITVTVVGKEIAAEVAEGAPKTTTRVDVPTIVENAKKNNLLSEEQLAVLDQGGSTDVKVTVAKKEATAEEKKLVEAQLNSTNKVGMYLDLGVAVVVKDANGNVIGSDVTVSETGTPVTFTVALDEALINTNSAVDRTYQVIRIHNGEVTVLPATFDAEGKTITFATDKFSTYALIYTDTPKKAKTPTTADTNTVGLYCAVMVAGLIASVMVISRKRA